MQINEDVLNALIELEEYVGNLGAVTGDSLVMYNNAGRVIAKAVAAKKASAVESCKASFREIPEAKAYAVLDELTEWHEVGRYK